MFAAVDIDCTLYSWAELAKSQGLHVFSLLAAKVKGGRFLYDCADRVFEKQAPALGERLRFLESFFGAEGAALYSSYPLTEGKRKILSSFSLSFYSSFPKRKTAKEIRKLCGRFPDLVIGDRKEDRDLSQALGAFWAGYPFYDFHHLLSGPPYTKSFVSLVKTAVSESRRGKAGLA